MTYTLADITAVFEGSNAEATKALYEALGCVTPAGAIAVNLLRACKTSGRAKQYRGSRYKGAAYDTKEWSLGNLDTLLTAHSGPLLIRWGWDVDEALKQREDPHYHVLYVDLPTGQVSFHTGCRGAGPDYSGVWDCARGASPARVCGWAAQLLSAPDAPTAVARCTRSPRCSMTWPRDPILEVACPECQAGIGHRCMRPSQHRTFGGKPHAARDLLADRAGHYGQCPLGLCGVAPAEPPKQNIAAGPAQPDLFGGAP